MASTAALQRPETASTAAGRSQRPVDTFVTVTCQAGAGGYKLQATNVLLGRMPGEGCIFIWSGSCSLASGWKGSVWSTGVRGARCRITATSPAERAMWERIGVQPCAEGGRIRQYTADGGALVVPNPEAIGYEARGWRAFRWLRTGLHREGVGLRGAYHSGNEAAGERGQSYEAMDGSTGLQESVGALKRGRRSGPASC
ncbi:hypothetical protein THAOC_26330 [Thalassiosira oceanica]|uniref:Uncharacterized protein n=1 Tax=Thalassiosira oceanica TaxID=159749 RepID=K0RLR5_THAOC|nr:hypothetical protein THAOC_26330 [Thalassiosira oceanica]|eukprot:EJK54110.1 hypothetical protein THAOC_26330 [Thalassiosira oceanica]